MDEENGFDSKIKNMRRSLIIRTVLTVLLVIAILYTIILSSLAGRGAGPFKNPRGFTSVPAFATCLMPAGYYYFIWVLVDFALLFIVIYAIVMVAQKFVLGSGKRQCGALPFSFLITLFISLNLNTGWLFAEDNLNASWSFIVSLFLLVSNCIALAYATFNFSTFGKCLHQESIMDFWMGIGVLNAMAVYTTWSLVQFLESFTVFLSFEIKHDMYKVCTGMIILLHLLIILWFIIENTWLTYTFNTIILHYGVLVWYVATLYPRQIQNSNSVMNGLLISNVVLAVLALFFRLVILYSRNKDNRLYKVNTLATTIVEEN
ncbi:uncharacterized protein LOC135103514 [Scylla paramamosain]|uniref:uncharacterized protein LOC135103514 n=1 Tax=Scylla paramamosain TaxID=85552 RepID=UPI00308392D4